MHTVFQRINEGDTILEDQFNNDVSILEDGTARFKIVESVTITSNADNVDLLIDAKGSGLPKLNKNLNANSNRITNLPAPASNNDAARKIYVDDGLALKADAANPTFTGTINGTLGTAAQPNVTSLGTQTAALNMGTNKIIGLATPTLDTDATTKKYADDGLALKVNTSSLSSLAATLSTAAQPNITSLGVQAAALDMGTNKIIGLGTPTLTTDATTKTYVDTADNLKLNLSGGTMSGAIVMGSNAISGVTTLTATTLAGTLSTAAQPNVTSVGTLTSLNVGTWSISGSNLTESVFANTLTSTSDGFSCENPIINETAYIVRDTTNSLDTAITQSGFLYSQKDLTLLSLKTNGNITLTTNGTGATICKTLRRVWAQITDSGVTYFTQNVNLDVLSMTVSSSYTGDFTLTSSTTFSVSTTTNYIVSITAHFLDTTNERSCQLDMLNNGSLLVAVYTALPYLDSANSYANAAGVFMTTLTAGNSYTFRFKSIGGGTADLTGLNVLIERA